jgi:NAD(P)-dependent dehydrogenase (short-subunit alcohol dehydrogenase family)
VELQSRVSSLFNLSGKVAIITGGAGLLGVQHAAAIASAGGRPVLVDISGQRAIEEAEKLANSYGVEAFGLAADITSRDSVLFMLETAIARYGRVDILINNAANNPKVDGDGLAAASRFENFSLDQWEADLAVGLTGTFLCCQLIGGSMAESGGGVIVNIASDLALISPDQRLYREDGVPDELQPVKPVSYSVVKSAMLGLTRYLATYWARKAVRVNALSPGGVYNGQPDAFVARLSDLIPAGRMAELNEYWGAILFLCSDASSYMTGSNLVVDGGRTCW